MGRHHTEADRGFLLIVELVESGDGTQRLGRITVANRTLDEKLVGAGSVRAVAQSCDGDDSR
jgi:hypothetical protein